MRLCSSIFISVFLHAAIFSLPVSLFETSGEQFVPVLLLSGADSGGGGAKAEGRRGKPERRSAPARGRPEAQTEARKTESRNEVPSPTETAIEISLSAEESVDDGIALATSFKVAASERNEPSGSTGESVGTGNGGGAAGSGGAGSRPGGGSGEGLSAGSAYAQARYAYNPKPRYPERARREGWEGTVIMAVLVDQKGRPERVEVGRSSGFADLDQAAAETVRRWLFQPARYGEKSMESWVKIPIVFRLADFKE